MLGKTADLPCYSVAPPVSEQLEVPDTETLLKTELGHTVGDTHEIKAKIKRSRSETQRTSLRFNVGRATTPPSRAKNETLEAHKTIAGTPTECSGGAEKLSML